MPSTTALFIRMQMLKHLANDNNQIAKLEPRKRVIFFEFISVVLNKACSVQLELNAMLVSVQTGC